jgi:hypothetical protein
MSRVPVTTAIFAGVITAAVKTAVDPPKPSSKPQTLPPRSQKPKLADPGPLNPMLWNDYLAQKRRQEQQEAAEANRAKQGKGGR